MPVMQALCLGGPKVASRILGPRLTPGVPERGIAVWNAVATRQALKVSRALSTSKIT